MTSASVPGIHGWGNLCSPSPSGALGLSPRYGEGLRALFLFGCGVAGMADHTRQHAWIAPFFSPSVFHDALSTLVFWKGEFGDSAPHSGWSTVAGTVIEAVAPGIPRTKEFCQ